MRDFFFQKLAKNFNARIEEHSAVLEIGLNQLDSFASILLSEIPQWKNNFFIILLSGEMGSGKTTFVKSIGNILGNMNVHSPTFSLLNIYETQNGDIFHFDFFRILSAPQRQQELEDLFWTPGLKCIEWPPSELMDCSIPRLELTWSFLDPHLRKLKIRMIE